MEADLQEIPNGYETGKPQLSTADRELGRSHEGQEQFVAFQGERSGIVFGNASEVLQYRKLGFGDSDGGQRGSRQTIPGFYGRPSKRTRICAVWKASGVRCRIPTLQESCRKKMRFIDVSIRRRRNKGNDHFLL